MSFYTSLQGVAKNLLVQFGTTMTHRRITTVVNPSTGVSTPTTVDTTFSGVVFPYEDKRVDGALIQRGDLKITAAGIDLAVADPRSSADYVIFAGDTLRVINVSKISPAGVPVVYELQVRSGG